MPVQEIANEKPKVLILARRAAELVWTACPTVVRSPAFSCGEAQAHWAMSSAIGPRSAASSLTLPNIAITKSLCPRETAACSAVPCTSSSNHLAACSRRRTCSAEEVVTAIAERLSRNAHEADHQQPTRAGEPLSGMLVESG